MVGPKLFSLVYGLTENTLPGAFYLAHCGILLASLVLLAFVRPRGEGVMRNLAEEAVESSALPPGEDTSD